MSSFFDIGLKKIIKIDFNVDISEEFIQCADAKLTASFVEATNLQIDQPFSINLWWNPEDPFVYIKGHTPKLDTNIALKYGNIKVSICWRSKSGKIYDINDSQINCDDIEFWFEGLDPDMCRHFLFPTWSLITFKESYIESVKRHSDLDVSKPFLVCADTQLSELYLKKTGLPLNKHVSLSDEWIDYTEGDLSSFIGSLTVNAFHNDIKVCWKSLSGRIYKLTDNDIDCTDIKFWFEGLDPLEYHKQLYPKEDLPFKLKSLGFELNIERLNTHATIDLFFKDRINDAKKSMEEIDDFVMSYNEKSLAKDRLYGVVHNWDKVFDEEKISYEIDLGSADVLFIKKFLIFLSKLNRFSTVVIS